MKKLILSVSFVVASVYAGKAQSALTIGIDKDICIDEITVGYTNNDQADLDLGCTGLYTFDMGTHTLSYALVNGVTCKAEETTAVKLSNGQVVLAKVRAIGKITFKAKEGATLAR